MKYNPSQPRPYRRRGKSYPGRWEIDLRGVLDNGLKVDRERRVFPLNKSAGKVGKRQAAAMALEEFERWNRHGQVLRPGEQPVLPQTGAMAHRACPTFAQFAQDFLAFCASPNASRKGANCSSTIDNKASAMRLHLLPAFGSMRMDTLHRRDVDRYITTKIQEGLAINSISNHLRTLQRMLHVARRYELLDAIPQIDVPPRKRGELVALDEEETQSFIAKARELFEPRRAVLLELYLRTGLRSTEAVALVPADFSLDVERPLVKVERKYTMGKYGPTKGRKSRVVPLHRGLAEELDALLCARELSPRCQERHPFSASYSARRPLHRRYVHDLVKRVGREMGTPSIHTHMLRHSFGTSCVRRGVPPMTLKEWMGHVSLDTTLGYVHLVAPDHLRWAHLLDD